MAPYSSPCVTQVSKKPRDPKLIQNDLIYSLDTRSSLYTHVRRSVVLQRCFAVKFQKCLWTMKPDFPLTWGGVNNDRILFLLYLKCV